MKRSKYNIFKKISGNNIAIFNSYSLAIAITDQDFFSLYDNLENIDIKKFNENEKNTYEAMLNCNFIINDETDEIKNLEYLRLKKLTNTNFFLLSIFPTLNCNFDCYYCYERNKKGIITKEVQEKTLDLIKYHAERKSDIFLTWHGGEPLLVFDIIYDLSVKIKDICKNNNVNYSSTIKSNGYLFTDDIISKLKDSNIDKIQVTLDGPPEVHNKRRYLKNSKGETFNKIMDNLNKLKMNNINIDISSTIDKRINIELMLELVKILEQNNLIEYFSLLAPEELQNYSKEERQNEYCFTAEEYKKYAFKFYMKLQELGIKKLENDFFPLKLSVNICDAIAHNALLIDPEGYLYKCPLDVGLQNKAVGNILESKTFNDNFFNNTVKYFTWNPFVFDKCNNCNLLPVCFGGCPRQGIQNNEPVCGDWKFVIEDLIETIAIDKINEKKTI